MQTAISLRHSDTVDVKFVLRHDGTDVQKLIAIPHVDLLELSRKTGHELTDAWCSRLGATHLKHTMETGEDIEKDLITVQPQELAQWASEIEREEKAEMERRRGAA
jgi:hypothetical protein